MNSIPEIIDLYGALTFSGAIVVMLFAGFTKGVVGFALPMITISGIGSLMSAEVAILALLFPGLVTNVWQSLRFGRQNAIIFLKRYRVIFIVMPVVLAITAQVFTKLHEDTLFTVLGVVVLAFALTELSGFRVRNLKNSPMVELLVAIGSGISGGLSGVWGPPTMMYLMARNIPKKEFVQTMGLVFMIGAVVLNLSHLKSGLLNSSSVGFTAMMVVPAVAGMATGNLLQDRMDPGKFRRATLVVLVFAALNLLRRGLY